MAAWRPSRAAAILAKETPSSKQAQSKPKSKRERFELQFTCNVCDAPNSHSISWHAYTKGTVLVTCPGCNASHLIADNLNWIEDDFKNLEDYMAKRGTPVSRVVTDGAAKAAAASAAAAVEADMDEDIHGSAPSEPAQKPIEGISDEQARRIREAVRKNKRKQRQDDGDGAA